MNPARIAWATLVGVGEICLSGYPRPSRLAAWMHRSASPSATTASAEAGAWIVAALGAEGVGEGLAGGLGNLVDACFGDDDSEDPRVLPPVPDAVHPATAAAPTNVQTMVRSTEPRLRAVADERALVSTCCPSGGAMPYNPAAGLQLCRRTFPYQESQTRCRSGRSS